MNNNHLLTLIRPFLLTTTIGNNQTINKRFFSLQSVINHDCSPNAMSGKQEDDHDCKIVIRAVKDIAEGEEVSLSYIRRGMPFATRQTQLKTTYRFECTCALCKEEASSIGGSGNNGSGSGDSAANQGGHDDGSKGTKRQRLD